MRARNGSDRTDQIGPIGKIGSAPPQCTWQRTTTERMKERLNDRPNERTNKRSEPKTAGAHAAAAADGDERAINRIAELPLGVRVAQQLPVCVAGWLAGWLSVCLSQMHLLSFVSIGNRDFHF